MYNRGDYCKAHIFNPTENVVFPHVQGHLGKKVGKVVSVKNGKALLSCKLNKGDAVKFISNNTETGTALISESGNATTYLGKAFPSSEVRLTTDKQLIDEVTRISDEEALNMTKRLSKELGLGVGISSGANFLASVLSGYSDVVTIFADDNKKYLSTDLTKEKDKKNYISDKIEFLSLEVL
jgi:hypothetical protein